jgi:hypothetical protein
VTAPLPKQQPPHTRINTPPPLVSCRARSKTWCAVISLSVVYILTLTARAKAARALGLEHCRT